ncbi:MAG: hypothetical protein IKD37_06825 [Clostridia bacterium]|nr:hypothetical protein [Clostridia bacterium]
MIRLPAVFSSGALFQQNSTLTLRGTAGGSSVSIRLILDGHTVTEAAASVSDGYFSAEIYTPAASLQPYTLQLFDGDELLLENILFGELWLASGQSNMAFTNAIMPGCNAYLDTLADLPIRIFVQDYPADKDSAEFPRQPSDVLGGSWCDAHNRDLLLAASAVGTAFLKELTGYLNNRIPVGILNAAWGGSNMRAWLPEADVLADPVLSAKFTEFNLFPDEETWNQHESENYHQSYCLYNCKIAPLLGVRIRGIIWYQGETDSAREFERKIYRAYLHCYHSAYAKRFAVDPQAFMMISSLLFHWSYGKSGETRVGTLNQALIDTAVENPNKFAFMPIGDLPPIWSFHFPNHPIHPSNKYDVGFRLALLAESNCYGRDTQRTPAVMHSYKQEGNRLLIRFMHVSSGLHIRGEKLRGLYIAGKDGLYMAARGEIVAPDTLAVYHPCLRNPLHAAYAYSSLEEGVNLFAGEFPVAPFSTQQDKPIKIECKPWLDLHRTSVWVNQPHDGLPDCFYRPIWQPLGGTEICPDRAFTQTDGSLRIAAEGENFGVFVKAYPYNRLDLQNYAALRLHLYNTVNLDAQLEVIYTEGNAVTLPIEKTDVLGDGWDAYAVHLGGLPEGEIERMNFRFVKHGCSLNFVNMESLMLVPKE